MNPVVFKFGGYQGPQSINTQGAARFGEVLRRELGDRADEVLAEQVRVDEAPGTHSFTDGDAVAAAVVDFWAPGP